MRNAVPIRRSGAIVFGGLAIALSLGAQEVRPRLIFEASEPQFDEATEAYRHLWAAEGARMVEALESHTGLRFDGGRNDYEAMWRAALEMTAEERAEKWRAFLAEASAGPSRERN